MSEKSSAKNTGRKRMSHTEIEQEVAKAFPDAGSLCVGLCGEWEHYYDLYEDALQNGDVAIEKRYLLLLNAISRQIVFNKCECRPQ
jgi:hypothetical protein